LRQAPAEYVMVAVMIADGMTASAAARQPAPETEGGTLDQKTERKLFGSSRTARLQINAPVRSKACGVVVRVFDFS